MKKIPSFLLNKYFITTVSIVVWMIFFDPKDFFYNMDRREELKKLRQKKDYYTAEIAKAKQELIDLQGNTAAIEKFGRERYMLKKDGEEVFIIEDTLAIKK